MNGQRVSPSLGVAGSLAVVLALVAPYVLLTEGESGLSVYYAAGAVGGGGVGVLALLTALALLAGVRGSADDQTAAGVALVIGLVTFASAVLWALAVDPELVLNFPATWMGWHRWLVVALSGVPAAAAAAYARAVV